MKKNEDKNRKFGGNSIVNSESIGFTFALFGVLLFLISCTGRFLFGAVGTAACDFLFGVFGFANYFVLAGLVFGCARLIVGKPIVAVKHFVVYLSLFLFCLFLTLHAFCVSVNGYNYGGYIGACYERGAGWVSGCTPLGVVGAVLWFPLHLATGYGAYAIVILLSLLFLALAVFSVLNHYGIPVFFNRQKPAKAPNTTEAQPTAKSFSEMDYDESVGRQGVPASPWRGGAEKPPVSPVVSQSAQSQPVRLQEQPKPEDYAALLRPQSPLPEDNGKKPFGDYKETLNELYKTSGIDHGFTDNLIFDKDSKYNLRLRSGNKPQSGVAGEPQGQAPSPSSPSQSEGQVFSQTNARMTEEVRYEAQTTEKEVIRQEPIGIRHYSSYNPEIYENPESAQSKAPSSFVEPISETKGEERREVYEKESVYEWERSPEARSEARLDEENQSFAPHREEEDEDVDFSSVGGYRPTDDRKRFDSDWEEEVLDRDNGERDKREEFRERFSDDAELFDENNPAEPDITDDEESWSDQGRFELREEPRAEERKPRIIKEYVSPPLDILRGYEGNEQSLSREEIEWTKNKIQDTLSGFGISVEIKKVTVGPVFARYDLILPPSIDINKVFRYRREISMSVQSENVNIYANFELGVVSIEVPNKKRATVGMKSLLNSDAYRVAPKGSLMFVVGKDAEGKSICCDLCKMPHMLVAGTTGSGKSVFLHGLIVSLIMRYSPEELRMIVIDPKWTEFSVYKDLPHLMINEILQDVKKIIVALNWAIAEMERRFRLFGEMTSKGIIARNIDEYNEKVARKEDRLPKLVIIADEVYDLMVQAQNDIESRIGRLVAKARAAGIHLVLATQRPSREVITGVLKANIPARFALKVDSELNSRIILDATGAEKLLGKGDLLYRAGSMPEPKRAQGAWIDSEEIQAVCDFIRKNNEAYYDEAVGAYIDSEGKQPISGVAASGGGSDEIEPVYIDALRFVIENKGASISMLQRKCSVGFNKAGRIIEWMEQKGYIAAPEGNSAKPRKVLITEDEFREKFGEI